MLDLLHLFGLSSSSDSTCKAPNPTARSMSYQLIVTYLPWYHHCCLRELSLSMLPGHQQNQQVTNSQLLNQPSTKLLSKLYSRSWVKEKQYGMRQLWSAQEVWVSQEVRQLPLPRELGVTSAGERHQVICPDLSCTSDHRQLPNTRIALKTSALLLQWSMDNFVGASCLLSLFFLTPADQWRVLFAVTNLLLHRQRVKEDIRLNIQLLPCLFL